MGISPQVEERDVWPKSFEEAFCQYYRCTSDRYVRKAFRSALYRHVLPFVGLLEAMDPDFFREDLDAVREIGCVKDSEIFKSEINRFYGRNIRDKSWLRRTFNLRISGKRLMKIKNRVIRYIENA